MRKLFQWILARRNVLERTIIQNGIHKTYYICNYGIPDSYQWVTAKNIPFDSKQEAINHALEIRNLVNKQKRMK